jgi:hypothetical protein
MCREERQYFDDLSFDALDIGEKAAIHIYSLIIQGGWSTKKAVINILCLHALDIREKAAIHTRFHIYFSVYPIFMEEGSTSTIIVFMHLTSGQRQQFQNDPCLCAALLCVY